MTFLPKLALSSHRGVLAALLATALAACASLPPPTIQRHGNVAQAPRAGDTTAAGEPGAVAIVNGVRTQALPAEAQGAPQAIIRRGTGQVINRGAASAPPPNLGGSSGAATFNFEGESLQAVVKAILGDMLGQNYVIAPGVQGTVTLATPKPVSPAAAMSLLEMVLGWNNARMV
jgi:general secretion pathway protein D